MKFFLIFLFIFSFGLTSVSASSDLAVSLSGRILLQVESHGEAWYVNPKDNKRYYLGRPDDAFSLMKTLSLGISEQEFASWNKGAPAWAVGGLFIRPQSHGEAYYVDFNQRWNYLGRPIDAWLLLRDKGLGISNNDLNKIESASVIVEEDNASNKIDISYKIVDTGVTTFYDDDSVISQPSSSNDFYGQDATYIINSPSYTDNGDGTVVDNITGLMWQKDMGVKMSLAEAKEKAEELNLGAYSDWRVPNIKELYSLILFTGKVENQRAVDFFIDTKYFSQPLGDTSIGEREIDAQTWSSTEYVGRTMNNDETIFGVNFIDGRIKGYPKYDPRTGVSKKMYFRFVRGNTEYGVNNFIDNGDGTISDLATGLMWQKEDSKKGLDWQGALAYAENLEINNYSDWRLPNAKELQSIVDYTRSPQTSNSAAINPIFYTSTIVDPSGANNYPFFWTSTTHLDGVNPESSAAYVCFGECQGRINNVVVDVHGAGAQRSDPKSGNINSYPQYFGPQGDIRYVYNYVRAVRNID